MDLEMDPGQWIFAALFYSAFSNANALNHQSSRRDSSQRVV
jgi:hypothetical protein